MKDVTLNCEEMTSKEATHTYLAMKLDFPNYYGKNLDALWDILSTVSEPLRIKLLNEEKLKVYLGDYGQSLLDVLNEAAEFNEKIIIDKLGMTED